MKDTLHPEARRGSTNRSRRAMLGQAGAVVLSFMATPLALGATPVIVAVRVWPAEEYTRVTLESDGPLTTRHQLHSDPHRLSIDIDGLELNTTLRDIVGKIRADDPYIANVRVAQYQPRVVRLVLDLKQPVAPQLFTLTPVAAYGHRLVFDLRPTIEVDPLLALIRDKDSAERKAAQAVRDALGDLISQVEGRGTPSTGTPTSPADPNRGKEPRVAGTDRPATAAPGPTAEQQRKVDRLIVVALDPGHGGEDPGAIGPTGLREKDVVLSIALQLRDKLNANPNMRVFMTRDADYFVPLQDRVLKARRVQADLFVSIHADAFTEQRARGASVYALSDRGATSAAANWLANKENRADEVGGINVKVARGDTQVIKAMLDMSTTAQIKDSLKLGGEVLHQLDRVGRLHKQNVEQAGFAVLKAPDVPSILVETAFISNRGEEAKLRDPEYQERLVDALNTGIKRYFAKNPPLARHRSL